MAGKCSLACRRSHLPPSLPLIPTHTQTCAPKRPSTSRSLALRAIVPPLPLRHSREAVREGGSSSPRACQRGELGTGASNSCTGWTSAEGRDLSIGFHERAACARACAEQRVRVKCGGGGKFGDGGGGRRGRDVVHAVARGRAVVHAEAQGRAVVHAEAHPRADDRGIPRSGAAARGRDVVRAVAHPRAVVHAEAHPRADDRGIPRSAAASERPGCRARGGASASNRAGSCGGERERLGHILHAGAEVQVKEERRGRGRRGRRCTAARVALLS